MDGGVFDDSDPEDDVLEVVEPIVDDRAGVAEPDEPSVAPGTPDGPSSPGFPPVPPLQALSLFDGIDDDDVELNSPVDALEEPDAEDDHAEDPRYSTRFRSMPKAFWLREASSLEHLASHFPQSVMPYLLSRPYAAASNRASARAV